MDWKSINWRRGRRRLFAVLWISWILLVAVYLPLGAARSQQHVYEMYVNMDDGNASAAVEAQRRKEQFEILPRTMFLYQLGAAVKGRIYWIAIIVGGGAAPLILYGTGLLLFRLTRWIARGFLPT